MEQNKIKHVTLRCYEGDELTYDKNGNVKNPNQQVTLVYNDAHWKRHVGNLPRIGFGVIEVEEVVDASENVSTEIPQAIIDEVNSIIAKPEVQLTPEQQRIADLEAQLAELKKLVGGNATAKVVDDNLLELRKQFEEKFKKKPHHTWSADVLTAKLAEA